MAEYILPHFGEVDTDNLEEYYDVAVLLNGHEVCIDLNFMDKAIDLDALRTVDGFIGTIAEQDKMNRKRILHDYHDENSGAVKEYVIRHIEEIGPADLSNLIDCNSKAITPELQLINALKLVRVGLYPYDLDELAIFDYTIGEDLTQYLLVLATDHNGAITRIAMES
ncbi:DUF2004 domain-containing protein [Niabella beijingensis]|uniref:DUF2004 domain-containing protein n=1 Tax=Niabella beijingensis TaxID=2872700 RepID=UPI001CBCFE36|nr:DUF2004 domain-containing protein [Niabella beijingensis]MBZ4192646.1 DUF2004 domain-containing protein [Niabella beijingensis]